MRSSRRQMVESGDWVQPRLAHARYYEKPPLMYWSIAAAHEMPGPAEVASRLPAALSYIAWSRSCFGSRSNCSGGAAW